MWRRLLRLIGIRSDSAAPKPDDRRLEIMSEGLNQASRELQDFVAVLKKKYPEEGDANGADA